MFTHKTVFMFSGQGSHYFQMGWELFEHNDVFRKWMIRLDDMARQLSGERVLDAIYSRSKSDVFDRTLLTHPAIFMVEYALAQCLLDTGVNPDMTLGASLGCFAAAAVAGFMSVADAMAAVIQQAAALEASCEQGGMIAVLAGQELFVQDFLCEYSELAAMNFASHFVVSAPASNLAAIQTALDQRNVTYQRLAVSYAFHSRWIEDARPPFESFIGSIRRGKGRLPLACCQQAAMLADLPDDFFWRAVRQPIRFQDTIAALERHAAYRYIDVGPAGTLATFAKYCLLPASRSTAHAILTPYGHDLKNLSAVLR